MRMKRFWRFTASNREEELSVNARVVLSDPEAMRVAREGEGGIGVLPAT